MGWDGSRTWSRHCILKREKKVKQSFKPAQRASQQHIKHDCIAWTLRRRGKYCMHMEASCRGVSGGAGEAMRLPSSKGD